MYKGINKKKLLQYSYLYTISLKNIIYNIRFLYFQIILYPGTINVETQQQTIVHKIYMYARYIVVKFHIYPSLLPQH